MKGNSLNYHFNYPHLDLFSVKVTLGFLFLLTAVPPTLGQENLPALVKKIEPSIVVIFTYDREGKILGQASGFFLSKEGDVLTNYHILQNAAIPTIISVGMTLINGIP